MTLSFYLARRFFWVFLAVIGIFAGLIFLMEMAEQLRRFAGTNAGLGKTGLLALLRTPGALYQILPLLSVLAALALFWVWHATVNWWRSAQLADQVWQFYGHLFYPP